MGQQSSAVSEEYPINFGDVTEFKARNPDESIYCYPHRYRIDTRNVGGVWQQRHVWLWDGDRTEIEDWIRGISP